MASSSSQPLPTPTSLSDELPPHLLPTPNFKNKLIEFTQRAGMAMPEYQSHNEGASHAPEFRASVLVDGTVFTSTITFFHRKAAVQEVSRAALEYMTKKIEEEGRSIMSKSVKFCKALLNEYAAKLNVKPPTYNTVEYKNVFPYFKSTMDFNCTSYIGEAARRKNDAEDLAARAAILSILDKSNSGIMLVQMIKAKAKLFDSVQSKTLALTCNNVIVSPIEKTELSCELNDEDMGVADPVGNGNINKTETISSESGPVISSYQQPEMPAPEAAKSSTDSPQPVNALSVDNVVSAKKRRRNKYKANKRARLDAQLKAISSNEVPPSEAQ